MMGAARGWRGLLSQVRGRARFAESSSRRVREAGMRPCLRQARHGAQHDVEAKTQRDEGDGAIAQGDGRGSVGER